MDEPSIEPKDESSGPTDASCNPPPAPRVRWNQSDTTAEKPAHASKPKAPSRLSLSWLSNQVVARKQAAAQAGLGAKPLHFVCFCVATTLVLMLCTQVAADVIWPECTPGEPCKYKKTQSQVLRDVIHERVPLVKKYAETADFSYFGEKRTPGLYEPGARDCVAPFVDGFRRRIGHDMHTSPELVREVVGYMKLENSTHAHRVLDNLWNESLTFEPMVNDIATCARANRPLHEVLCAWLDDPSIAAELATPPSGAGTDNLRYAMHGLLVQERFAQAAARSRDYRSFMSSHYTSHDQEAEAGMVKRARVEGESEARLKFRLEKWNSIFQPSQELTYMALDGGDPARALEGLQKLAALNILEATDVDRALGANENANLGIALAAAVAGTVSYTDQERNFVAPYSKEFYDAYVVWNLNYVAQLQHLDVVAKLLIPSILCTSEEANRHNWFAARSVSLKTTLFMSAFETQSRRREQSVVRMSPTARVASARIAGQHLDLAAPAACCGFGSLHQLWKSLAPYPLGARFGSSLLRDEWFEVYLVVIVWCCVVLAGLGMELVIGPVMMTALARREDGFVLWHFAQLTFSLMLAVAISADSGVGLLFLALGLWKMGFPETVSQLLHFQSAEKKLSPHRVACLIGGMGTLLHHFSTAMIVTAISMHLFPRSRPLLAACIVPIMQHLFILLKYHCRWAYILIELGLEVWFQIEVLTNLSEFETGVSREIDNFGRGLAISMLLAHYLYLTDATINLIAGLFPSAADKAEASEEDSFAMMRGERKRAPAACTGDRCAASSTASATKPASVDVESALPGACSRPARLERTVTVAQRKWMTDLSFRASKWSVAQE